MSGSAPPSLRANRFDLEALSVDHAPEMAGVLADPSLYQFTGGAPPTRSELERRYAAQTAGPPDGRQRWLNWVVRDRGTGALVGFVQATVDGDAAEVAWVTGAAFQGRGAATEAVSAMVRWLSVQGVVTVLAHVHPDHAASRAVAARAGMVETDVVVDGETRWVLRSPVDG